MAKQISAPWARTTGLLYTGTIVTGVFSAFFVRQLIVRGDAAATAQNLLASETLFRLGVLSEIAGIACYIGVTALLYELLKPVSRRVSLIAAFFSIVGCAVGAVNAAIDLAPFVLLNGMPYLSVFPAAQLQAVAMVFIRVGGQLNTAGLLFFGFYCVLIGSLVFRSSFLPSAVGVVMALAGLSWLIGSVTSLLLPAMGAIVSPLTFAGIAGEATLTLWLLVFGVNIEKWREQLG